MDKSIKLNQRSQWNKAFDREDFPRSIIKLVISLFKPFKKPFKDARESLSNFCSLFIFIYINTYDYHCVLWKNYSFYKKEFKDINL